MRLQKLISSALSITTALTMLGMGADVAFAGRLKSASVNMTVVRANTTSNHTISFNVASTTNVAAVKFEYRRNASTDANYPSGLALNGASKGAILVKGASDTDNWTLTADDVNKNLLYVATTPIGSLSSGHTFSFETQSITNNNTITGAGECDSVVDSDTCWVRITTYSDAGATTPIDTSTATYTVVNPITMTATVDPILTFVITPVDAGTMPDAGMGQNASATSTTKTLPFGNLTLGSARVVAQQLTVLTNANNGYTVYNKFIGRNDNGTEGGTQLLTGTVEGNNIDPFPAGAGTGWLTDGAGNTAAVWSVPSGGTKNIDTGWLGMRTNNTGTDVGSNFSTENTWAPPYVGSANGRIVMRSAIPDNGTVRTTVSYKMQANAFQPSDLYTGVTVYNVVASY